MLPAVEVALGLAMLFFVLALASTSVVEIIGTAFKLRASGVERTVRTMLGSPEMATQFVQSRVVSTLREADVAWSILGRPKQSKTVRIEATRRLPSQLPARAFADGVVDVLTDLKSGARTAEDLFTRLPAPLRDRLQPILDETESDLVALKARLEQWFDDSMQGLDRMHRKWARKMAFVVGLVLTVTLNASALHVAQRLWSNSAERAAVVAAVDDLVTDTAAPTGAATSFQQVADQIGALDSMGIPLGWADQDVTTAWVFVTVLGWLITALLVRLGAPFWHDVLTRLFAVRRGLVSGPATADPASATTQIAMETRDGSRTTYAQTTRDRAVIATPVSSPAIRLFDALPTRTAGVAVAPPTTIAPPWPPLLPPPGE